MTLTIKKDNRSPLTIYLDPDLEFNISTVASSLNMKKNQLVVQILKEVLSTDYNRPDNINKLDQILKAVNLIVNYLVSKEVK